MKSVQVVQKRLFQLLIFLLPSQLGRHFWPASSKIFGIRIDYLSPTIYLTDILVVALLLFSFTRFITKKRKIKARKFRFWILPFLFALLNIYFSVSPITSLIFWLRICEVLFVIYFIAKSKELDFKTWIAKPLTIALFYVICLEVLQIVFQGSVGGIFYFLGERTFTVHTPAIALVEIFGKNLLRPYSTFSHPNSLAGFLLASFCLIEFNRIINNRKIEYKKILLISSGVLIAFSNTVYITSLILLVILWVAKYREANVGVLINVVVVLVMLLSLLIPFISSSYMKSNMTQTIQRRMDLGYAAGQMIKENSLVGVGGGGFIIKLPNYILKNQTVWWLQPVHNIFLLVFAETGLLGFILFVAALVDATVRTEKNDKKYLYISLALLTIIITGFNDHYWLTLQQNRLLFSVILGLSFKKKIL